MSFELLLPALPKYSVIVEVDWNGKIVNSWHSNSPDARFFSDAKIIVSTCFSSSVFLLLILVRVTFRTATCTWDLPITISLVALKYQDRFILSNNRFCHSDKIISTLVSLNPVSNLN